LFKGYGAKICRLTTYVKAENRMVTPYCSSLIYQKRIIIMSVVFVSFNEKLNNWALFTLLF
jgi:hypothetical protein